MHLYEKWKYSDGIRWSELQVSKLFLRSSHVYINANMWPINAYITANQGKSLAWLDSFLLIFWVVSVPMEFFYHLSLEYFEQLLFGICIDTV